jgi:hypothetical protein
LCADDHARGHNRLDDAHGCARANARLCLDHDARDCGDRVGAKCTSPSMGGRAVGA